MTDVKIHTKESNDTKEQSGVLEHIKHPLEDTWCIWLCTNNNSDWGKNLVNLASFDTVEDWWCLYHHMKLPSELEVGQDYAIFKKGISPTWEDEANTNGGRWIFSFGRNVSDLDSKWLLTVLILIGATLTEKAAVCGAVVNFRKDKIKIGIWITDASKKAKILSIGNQMKFKMSFKKSINFHKHNEPINMYFI
ncbi:eukaryotic translation initiation factor 4E-1A-like isoform X1 [Danaus plexippus]|uniref:eukaryotic translation initiation factor 4E-1A-like isoform X1 n=1 Tax=Danaus plexippus TaxID=13037 RepID=UPI002AB11701|nr:eukaryotic translation initiation factor 4E-1A-like isoform X1 [Danaus plexippus]